MGVGSAVGTFVGGFEGRGVGSAVGTFVGGFEGTGVGLGDGGDVGLDVVGCSIEATRQTEE